MEPLIRDSLAMASEELPWPGTAVVGGWWNRSFNPEVNLVGADRGPVARQVFFTGSVKWVGGKFDGHALRAMFEASARVPGVVPGQTGTVVVSRSGMAAGVGPVDVHWGPDDIVGVWPV